MVGSVERRKRGERECGESLVRSESLVGRWEAWKRGVRECRADGGDSRADVHVEWSEAGIPRAQWRGSVQWDRTQRAQWERNCLGCSCQ